MDQTRTARRPFLATATLATALALGLTACSVSDAESTASPSATDTASTSAEATPSASESATAESSPAADSASPSASASVSSAQVSSAEASIPAPESNSPTSPSATGSPSAAASSSASASSSAPQAASEVTVYWVSLAGEGPAGVEFPGCGDTLIEDTAPATSAGAVGEPSRVEAGIQALLDQTQNQVGGSGLVNALYQSELEVQDVSIDGDVVTVELAGTPVSAGTCDDPRIMSQLEYTAVANAGAYTAEILVNGRPIAEVMSQAGA
jgi:hypothetical protein